MDYHSLPSKIPDLPSLPDGLHSWSANVVRAYKTLSLSYMRAYELLGQEPDPIRLNMQIADMLETDFGLLIALEANVEDKQLSHTWLRNLAILFKNTLELLDNASAQTDNMDQINVSHIAPVSTLKTGRRGRPRKVINRDYLKEAMSHGRNITRTKLGKHLHVHRHTIRQQMSANNISKTFSDISDNDLDNLIREFRQSNPDDGLSFVIGFLRSQGLYVQQDRVIASIKRVDGLGTTIRASKTIKRRVYRTSRPNALWHMDGHHKLILWGIVIHGFIDGYTRMVTGLVASNNNQAETVLQVFLQAAKKYGTPSRLRGDRGGENIRTAVYMIMTRGVLRASYIWGPSTRNTRIERLWVEVGRHFARAWRAFFYRLERLHRLDRSNPQHIWLLHALFLGSINADCSRFQNIWNAKPISGLPGNESPNDMYLLGVTDHGLVDDCEGLHPDTISRYYDVDQGAELPWSSSRTGAGHDSEEEDSDREEGYSDHEDSNSDHEDSDSDHEDSDSDHEDSNSDHEDSNSDHEEGDSDHEEGGSNHKELIELIEEDLHREVRHDAIEVASTECPFDSEGVQQLWDSLSITSAQQALPIGFGIRQEEWENEEYPRNEIITVGAKGLKALDVSLSDEIWRPRAERWTQALDIMTRMIDLRDRDDSRGSSMEISDQDSHDSMGSGERESSHIDSESDSDHAMSE